MTSLIQIEASPRGSASRSSAAAAAMLSALRELEPDLSVDRLDLWDTDLPAFDGAALAAKYGRLSGRDHDEAEQAAWTSIETMVARLARADRILISTPMWNFGIPYRLKHWFDLITQPGLSFSFDPTSGYAPLLKARPTLVILASAGNYASGESRGRPDLATPYLRAALGFIGLTNAMIVPLGPTVGREVDAVQTAVEVRLREMAPRFLRGAR